eukprot:CAMPEP_0176360208 /NCGR_PEP_ID=MMETSP0126-20121128/16943_1 /TAXON_ID=141414 ORGANISM="Strombidinopsis acuminatum, Strain SPMC142" /NCGR_SAMPLE_ID=MMETSP0126 /ASSEMBLY_ACC=CAM_ASM_000229 /LENGTH=53 /DNA_ID=CAMNT_0017715385 /DNA_START=138 /DNA_END=302 /DNA_ORIENTATION=-
MNSSIELIVKYYTDTNQPDKITDLANDYIESNMYNTDSLAERMKWFLTERTFL